MSICLTIRYMHRMSDVLLFKRMLLKYLFTYLNISWENLE